MILQVNVRSASGRGQLHTGSCYQQLGVQELKDLEDAVDHVCTKLGGDPARVAIGGWSYGGTMAAFALTHSKKFALGFAMVWHIWWLVALSFAATIVGAIYHTFNYKRDFDIPAATVTAVEDARTRQLAGA